MANGEQLLFEILVLYRGSEADDKLKTFIEISGWKDCGYDTFTECWRAEAIPMMAESKDFLRTRKSRNMVTAQVMKENASLPRAQRITKKELRAMVFGPHRRLARSTGRPVLYGLAPGFAARWEAITESKRDPT